MPFDWTLLSPANKPSTRDMQWITKDKARNKIVLCLGARAFTDASSYTQDTWTYDGNDWTQYGGSSPGKRTYHPYIYDEVNQNVVLFGGMNSSYAALQDTWLWDGSSWSNPNPAHKPGVRHSASMAWDAANGYVLLYGGITGSTYYDETWKWDGNDWTNLNPPAKPGYRGQAALTYDPIIGAVILFGGTNASGQQTTTWKWDGSTWTNLNPAHHPANFDSMYYCLSHGKVVLHRGGDVGTFWSWDGSDWSGPLTTDNGTHAGTQAICEGLTLGSVIMWMGQGVGSWWNDIYEGYDSDWVPPVPAYPIMNNEISLLGNGAPGDSPFHHMVKLN